MLLLLLLLLMTMTMSDVRAQTPLMLRLHAPWHRPRCCARALLLLMMLVT